MHGNAIGSSGIAKKVRSVGGGAVKGYLSQSNEWGYGSSGTSTAIEERVTVFAVIKYLPEKESAPNPPLP